MGEDKDREIVEPPLHVEPVQTSPPWGRSTKIVVVVVALLLLALTAQRFQGLIVMTVMAGILAYVLNPLVEFVNERTRLSRGLTILLLYLLILVGFAWLIGVLGVAAFQQAADLVRIAPELIDETVAFFAELNARTEPIVFLGFSIDPLLLPWETITDQLLGLVEPLVSSSGQVVGSLATRTARLLGNLFFVFIISIYLAYELPQFGRYIGRLASQPGYQYDAERLTREFGRIWSAYLRGQLLLAFVIFGAVWIGLSILGVENSLGLALLSGVLELVPNLGPIIGAFVAIIVAFFQPTNPWGLESWQFAVAVLILMLLIQQLENNLLVPRILGGALDLHPLVVIVGVFMGATIAGILGAILAAPVLATLKLLGIYAWRKLFDLPPFPYPDVEEPPPPVLHGIRMRWQGLMERFER